MTSRAVLIISVLTVALISFYHRIYSENKSLKLFERIANRSLCSLCLGNDSFCDTLDFQLDHKRYLIQHSSYLYIFFSVMICLFNLLTNQQNDQVFFGNLRLGNGSVVNAVAKSPGYYYSDIFEQTVDSFIDIDKMIIDDHWPLLSYSSERRSLVLCSKYDINPNMLVRTFLSSVVNINDKNNLQPLVEAWTAAHLSIEVLVLKILNGYRFVPDIYGACGRVYFVEDCGYTLQYYLNKLNLRNRLLVAMELLKMALELTDGTAHPNYSFYLTDITADNIAIQLDDTSESLISLKVIDWSDVIVVVSDHNMTKNDNLKIHISEHVDCEQGCLIYSKENICQANFSDHNVYAVCKEFLSREGKLLHEITDPNNSKNEQEKELESLLNHCLWHSGVEQHSKEGRLDTAKLIVTKIQHILLQGTAVHEIVRSVPAAEGRRLNGLPGCCYINGLWRR